MFDFMFMTPEPVARFELPDLFGRQGLIIDTAGGMDDSLHPYETAVSHPEYNNGDWVIVASYDTEDEAYKGHEKWIKIMTADSLPVELIDISTASIARLRDDVCGNAFRKNPRTIDITPIEQKQLPEQI